MTWKKELQLTKIKQILQNMNDNLGTNHKYYYCQMFKDLTMDSYFLIKAFKNFYKLFIDNKCFLLLLGCLD